jgi:hypothetical protein
MATDNDYIDQLASSLSESIVDLAKVGYADQFIANGIEAYRGGEEIARKVAGLLPGVRENRREFTAYFDDPSGQIVDPIFRRFDYETQRSLSRLARDYFHAVDRFEEWAQEGILLGQMIQERGAVLALVAELQRLLHRPNKTGKTLLKLHEKRKLELFVDMGRGPKWHLLGDWESQRDAAATTAATEAQRALNATMQPFPGEIVGRMFVRSFNKPSNPYTGLPGSCYKLNISSLPSTWDVEKELKNLIDDSKRRMDTGKELLRAVNGFSQSLVNEILAAQKNLLDQLHC